MSKPATERQPANRSHILSDLAFARISAVEGFALSADTAAMLARFDQQGRTMPERLVAVITAHSPPGTLHVVPHRDGWAVRKAGTSRAMRVFGTADAALGFARDAARRAGDMLVQHAADGRILRRSRHGERAKP